MRSKPFYKLDFGFTLVELLLQIAMMAILFSVFIVFLNIIVQARVRRDVVVEVENQGLIAMDDIMQSVRNADQIIVPAPGETVDALQLGFVNTALNPTIIDIDNQVLQIKEGASLPVGLMAGSVRVTAFSVTNVSGLSGHEAVRVIFTLERDNPFGTRLYNFMRTFDTTGTLRTP